MDFDGIDVETDDYKVKLPLVLGDGLFGVIDRGNSDGNLPGRITMRMLTIMMVFRWAFSLDHEGFLLSGGVRNHR